MHRFDCSNACDRRFDLNQHSRSAAKRFIVDLVVRCVLGPRPQVMSLDRDQTPDDGFV